MNDWFPDLDPPPGGLRSLRARLDEPRRRWWPALALLAVAVLVAVLWPRPRAELALDAGLLAWVEPPAAPVSPIPAGHTTVERVPVDVVWYRVHPSTAPGPGPGG